MPLTASGRSLAAAASGAVLGAAAGIAALTPLPAPFVLAGFAVGVCFVARFERHAGVPPD